MTQMQTHEFKQIRVSGFEMINWKLNQLHIRWFAWLAILIQYIPFTNIQGVVHL